MLRLGTTLAECVLTHILAGFGTQKGSIWRRGLQGVIAKRKLRNRWIQFPHLQMKNWRSGREAQIYCSRIHTPGSKWLTLIFWCWWLLREMKPAIFFFPPEGLCLLWFYPTACIFHLLPFCSLPSQASVAFSSVSVIRADFHVCVLMSNLFSLSYKTFLSLWSHCKMIPFLLVSMSVADLIFLVISIGYITPFSFHSACFKDTVNVTVGRTST